MQVSIFRDKSFSFIRAAWLMVTIAAAPPLCAGDWLPLAKDGIHDPKSPAAKQLQEPREALSKFTSDIVGNQVRWVQVLEKGEISPRERLRESTEIRKLDQDILLNLKGGMPIVRFPHKQHTEWLDCNNCHDKANIFAKETGKSNISMFSILQGEQCGICHGAVAFPLTECFRCHSVVRPGGKINPGSGTPMPMPSFHDLKGRKP